MAAGVGKQVVALAGDGGVCSRGGDWGGEIRGQLRGEDRGGGWGKNVACVQNGEKTWSKS